MLHCLSDEPGYDQPDQNDQTDPTMYWLGDHAPLSLRDPHAEDDPSYRPVYLDDEQASQYETDREYARAATEQARVARIRLAMTATITTWEDWGAELAM